jgi:hypothetical protein
MEPPGALSGLAEHADAGCWTGTRSAVCVEK